MPDFRYPKYDLDQSVDVARRISQRGAGATVSSHELAALLDYSGTNNGAFLNRVAAARLFGLIDGQADTIAATERAERILRIDQPEAAEQAKIEAFKSVPLYAAFLDAFRGRPLSEPPALANTLVTRFKVPEAEAGRVLGRLLLSAEQAGLFRVGGTSRMIEPTYTRTSGHTAGDEPQVPPLRTDPPNIPDPGQRRFPKIIDGALDLMPSGPPWEEAEYREWLAFFDQACRVYYRIPRGGKTVET